MRRVLLLSHTTGYQLRAFNDAAEALGMELLFATDRCHRLDDPWQDRAVAVRFHELEPSVDAIAARAAARTACRRHRGWRSARRPGGPRRRRARSAVALGRRRHREHRQAPLARGASPTPGCRPPRSPCCLRARRVGFVLRASGSGRARRVGFPCVLKPVGLSGSRGVIRANDAARVRRALRDESAPCWRGPRSARPQRPAGRHPRRDSTSPAASSRWKERSPTAHFRSWRSSTSPIRWSGRFSKRRST